MTDLDVDVARAALRAGQRIRIVVGDPPEPTVIYSLDEGMVIATSVAGWSNGVVEAVCGIDSDFLRTRLIGRQSIEIIPGEAP